VKPLGLKRIEPTKPSDIQPVTFAYAYHASSEWGCWCVVIALVGRCICSWYALRALPVRALNRRLEDRASGNLAVGLGVSMVEFQTQTNLGFGACGVLRLWCWWAVACDLFAALRSCAFMSREILSRCQSRPPIRPVLKHGPRSLAYTRVIGR
jgi:hypothetical protein